MVEDIGGGTDRSVDGESRRAVLWLPHASCASSHPGARGSSSPTSRPVGPGSEGSLVAGWTPALHRQHVSGPSAPLHD